MRGRLLREADLTLEKAIDICCASEITSSQVKELTEKEEVNRFRTVMTKDNKSTANTGKTEQKEASAADMDLSMEQKMSSIWPNMQIMP